MHADEGVADVHARFGEMPDVFHQHRVVEALVGDGAERAARMIGLGNGVDLLEVIAFHAAALHYYGAVEMLAALRCEKHAGGLEHRLDAIEKIRSHAHGCVRANALAQHFA